MSANFLLATVSRTYISGEQRVDRESTALALIIGSEYNEDVLDADHQGESPNDERERAQQIIIAGLRAEGGGIDIERTGPNVTIDDANGLVGKPEKVFAMEVLGGHSISQEAHGAHQSKSKPVCV